MRLSHLTHTLAALGATAVLGACGGSDIPDTPREAPPAELAGDWKYGTISPSWFWDEDSQMVQSGGGVAVLFSFRQDGTYEEYIYVSIRNFNCNTQSWSYTKGTVTFESSTFTIYPATGRSKVTDSCIPSNNTDRPLSEEGKKPDTYYWAAEPQADGTTKIMIGTRADNLNEFTPAN